MYMHNFKVQRLDGTIYDLEDVGFIVNSFIVESPSPIHYREKIEGQSGFVDLGTDYDGRKIITRITLVTADADFITLQNEVFQIFDSKQAFYILPDEYEGKRILVKNDSPYSIPRNGDTGEFSLTLISENAYLESIDSTLNMPIANMTGTQPVSYKQTISSFEILNDGDLTIDPRKVPLLIQFKGPSTNLQILNKTTGELWSFTGTTQAGDTLQINNTRSLKNGVSVFSNTNRKLITLAPGWNEFQLTGASGTFEISFDFRFYTL